MDDADTSLHGELYSALQDHSASGKEKFKDMSIKIYSLLKHMTPSKYLAKFHYQECQGIFDLKKIENETRYFLIKLLETKNPDFTLLYFEKDQNNPSLYRNKCIE